MPESFAGHATRVLNDAHIIINIASEKFNDEGMTKDMLDHVGETK